MTVLSTAEVEDLRDLSLGADDQDTGTLDAFREAATPAAVYELALAWLEGDDK